MKHQGGFSVPEAMAALLVLSLALLPIGHFILAFAKGLSSANRSLETQTELRRLAESTSNIETAMEDSSSVVRQMGQYRGLGAIAHPRITQDANCSFDMVGRRCR